MRKPVMMLGLAMVILIVTTGVALAVTKTCNNIPCRGTDNDDLLYEREGSKKDRIYGEQGRDDISAATFSGDNDRLFGGPQGDDLVTSDRDTRDLAAGGQGADDCTITDTPSGTDSTRSCNVHIVSASEVPEGGFEPQGFGDTETSP